MKFIGIDLAWTYKNETGLCILDDSGAVEYLESEVYTNEDIINIMRQYADGPFTVAIDAPLIVNNEGGSRGAEGAMMREKINGHRLRAFNANRNYFMKVFGEIRGETLMHLIQKEYPSVQTGLSDTHSNIIETFPTGIISGLFPDIAPVKYKRKSKMTFAETVVEMNRLIARLDILENRDHTISGLTAETDINITDKKSHKHLEDKIDAVLCALGVYYIYKGWASEKTFGTLDAGFITIPVIEKGD